MKKLALVAWNELQVLVRDPLLWLLALAAPLLVAALISLAFGDLVLGQALPAARIAVGIVNADQGGAWGNLGAIFERVFLGDEEAPLPPELRFPIFAGRAVADEAAARRLLAGGRLYAALIIPPDFSEALAQERATVYVLVGGHDPALAGAFVAAVETVAQSIALGEVTIRTAANGLLAHGRTRAQLSAGRFDAALTDLALAALQPSAQPVQIERRPGPNRPPPIRLTHYLAVAIALTMLGLTSLLISATVFQEQAQWTLQRSLMTPTPPAIILLGKTAGAFATGLVQVLALIGGLALLEWALHGVDAAGARLAPLGLSGLILAALIAVTGYGLLIAGLTRSYPQTLYLGGALLIVSGLVGGIFFPTEQLPPALQGLARASYQFWAMDAYLRLARGADGRAIWPNLAALVGFGLATAALGQALIRRRCAGA